MISTYYDGSGLAGLLSFKISKAIAERENPSVTENLSNNA